MEPDQNQDEIEAHYSTASENNAEAVRLDLEPCPICTRTFVPATLAKHIKICEKMAMKKRKKFDSSKQRREGTDLADFLPKNFGLPPSKQEPKLSPKTTQSAPIMSPKKQEDPVKQTTVTQKKILETAPSQPAIASAPPKEKDKPKAVAKRSLGLPSEQCPYCERCFGLKAYDRHVEWCKEKSRINNIKNSSSYSAAKERLQARTKYRAPCVKSKRAANREKYSGFNCEESTNSLSDGGNGDGIKPNGEEQKKFMSTSLNSSIMSDGLSPKISSVNNKDKIVKTRFKSSSEGSVLKCEESQSLVVSSNAKKTVGSVKQSQRSSLNYTEPKIVSASTASNTKGTRTFKSRKLLEAFTPVSLVTPKSSCEPTDELSYLNDSIANVQNLELSGTACITSVDSEKYLEDNIDRTSCIFLTDKEEDQNSTEEEIVGDDLMAININTQEVSFESHSPSSINVSYDDITVGNVNILHPYEPIYEDHEEESKNLIQSPKRQETIQYGKEELLEESEKEDTIVSLTYEMISENMRRPFSVQDSRNEDLDPDIAEFYSYAPECAKSYAEEEERVKEKMNKLTTEQTEFFDSTENDCTLSFKLIEEEGNNNSKDMLFHEMQNIPSPTKSFTVRSRSPTSMNLDYEKDEGNREIFISIETNQNDCSPSPTDPLTIYPNNEEDVDTNGNKEQRIKEEPIFVRDEKQDIFEDVNKNNAKNIMKKVEHELNQNDRNMAHTCDSATTMYPVDSDEISSVECYPVRKNVKSKQSADSAYGSLSRYSPMDQWSLRRNLPRSRQQITTSIPEQQLQPKSKHLQRRERSASSSGSDSSLPPIQPLKDKEKHYHEDESQSKKDIRMSKFCHECGSKFPITHAKFCMECGVRRIALD